MAVQRYERTFEESAEQVRAVRLFVRTVLAEFDTAPVDYAVLIASELAANAIVHARSVFTVSLMINPDESRLVIGVSDLDERSPAPTRPETTALSGRGLAMVETVAASWGSHSRPHGGKTVWAELPMASTQPL